MPKVQEALDRHMMAHGTCRETLEDLLMSGPRAGVLMAGEDVPTLYEATLLAAYFRTSVREFIDPN
jgi:hypothetical protein